MMLRTKRHVCLCATAVVVGIMLYQWSERFWPLFCLIAVGIGILFWLRYRGHSKNAAEQLIVILVLGGLLVLTCLDCSLQQQQYQRQISCLGENSQICLTGVVWKKEAKSDQYIYYLKNTTSINDLTETEGVSAIADQVLPDVSSEKKSESKKRELLKKKKEKREADCGTVLFYFDADNIPIGATVRAEGEVQLFSHAANEGGFDAAEYYRQQKISGRIYGTTLECLTVPKISWGELLYRFQKRISQVFEEELSGEDAGILGTLVLGNKSMLDAEVKELYQSAGISHILAISGLHISVLGLSIFRFLRRRTGCYPLAAAVSIVVIWSFAFMSGFGVSGRRAAIMFTIMMAGQVLGRRYEMIHGVSIAAILLLLVNPWNLFLSGFQFSFLAMIAIFFVGRMIPDGGSKIGRQLLSGLILQLWLCPLTAWYYYEVPLYAIFLNILVLPLCSYLLGVGMLGGIVGLRFRVISRWMLIFCHFILRFYRGLIFVTNALPGSQILTGRPGILKMGVFFTVLTLICICMSVRQYKSGQKQRGTSGQKETGQKQPGISEQKETGQKRNLKAYRGLLVPIVLFVLFFLLPGKQTFCIDFLDVGQGDGICITSADGTHIFIDGGSTSESAVGTYTILPYLKYHRIDHIDVWIVTHQDSDHISGLEELLQSGYEIDTMVLASAMPEDEGRQTLEQLAAENGTEVVTVGTGAEINCRDFTMSMLYPATTDTSDDVNDLSQVWQLQTVAGSVLFTGDITSEAEKLLLQRGLLSESTILKVAHHGSKYSSSTEFLNTVHPLLAIISCGEKNRYGHPHPETLERLEAVEADVQRTNLEGQIKVIIKGESFAVSTGE